MHIAAMLLEQWLFWRGRSRVNKVSFAWLPEGLARSEYVTLSTFVHNLDFCRRKLPPRGAISSDGQ